jgi:hypothetical protein
MPIGERTVITTTATATIGSAPAEQQVATESSQKCCCCPDDSPGLERGKGGGFPSRSQCETLLGELKTEAPPPSTRDCSNDASRRVPPRAQAKFPAARERAPLGAAQAAGEIALCQGRARRGPGGDLSRRCRMQAPEGPGAGMTAGGVQRAARLPRSRSPRLHDAISGVVGARCRLGPWQIFRCCSQ